MTPETWTSPQFIYSSGDRPLDGYTIKRGIGRGGFGEVYYAISDGGKEVALKVVQRHLDVELRGVTQCLNLKHPNLVTIYDVKQSPNGDYWIVMEHVSGTSLSDTIAANSTGVSHDQILAWLHGICAGVGHLHEHGIVHRDLKPGNIFLENGSVKIGDYGLAKYISASRRSGQTESVGTVHYMAPEISRGRYGKEIDLYALGVIIFEMLTGRLPFNGESPGEILMRHLTEQPDLSMLPDPYRSVVTRLLDKDPDRRYGNVTELLAELGGEAEPAAPRIKQPPSVDRTPRPLPTVNWAAPTGTPARSGSKRRLRWGIFAFVAVAVGLFVVAVMFSNPVQMYLESNGNRSDPANSGSHDNPGAQATATQTNAVAFLAVPVSMLIGTAGMFYLFTRRSRYDLYRAARSGDISRVRSLLADGADVHSRQCGNRTVLIAAAEAGHIAVVQHLLECGADPTARSSSGETALSRATLAGHGAIVESLIAAGADVNSRARDGDTPLIEAAYAGHVSILRLLLIHHADLTARSGSDGRTPLIWASAQGHTQCVEALLEYGAQVNEKDTGDGSTAIIWAAYGNHTNVVRILLDHGADPTETNTDGETALDYSESESLTALLQSAVERR